MRITVIGGTGRIGSKLVEKLAAHGHEALAAGPSTGVDTITGEGVAGAVEGAHVVVDVTNAPTFDEGPATDFFTTSTSNLLAAEAAARVRHHVALSVVGTDRLAQSSGYFRAKRAQERLIKSSSVPYSIVHATQFFEFITAIADVGSDGDIVRLAPVLIPPLAADDVAEEVGRVAVGDPVNGIVEVAGPDRFRLDELVRRRLGAAGDPREVVADPAAGYFGFQIGERDLLPADGAHVGRTRLEDWLREPANAA